MSASAGRGHEPRSTAADACWWGVALLAMWWPVGWRLSEVWRLDPEMRHGWLVPPLVAYLVWDRRRHAPAATAAGSGVSLLVGVLSLGVAALGWWIWEANPEWPRLMWLNTATVAVATLALIVWREGWPRAQYWAGPLALLFFALPWPTVVQQPLTLGLASLNAHVAAEVVSALGHPAAVHGRIIEVGAGLAGVDEACSGMRSLQTVTMVAVFLAVFLRLGWKRGAGLLAASWGLALLGNLLRTCYLILVLAKDGEAAMNALHDTAGNIVLGATLGLLSIVAWVVPERPLPRRPPEFPVPRHRHRSWPVVVGLVMTVVLIEGAIAHWYAHGGQTSPRVGWTWANRDDWQPAVVSDAARDLLRFSEGSGRYWPATGAGAPLLAFLFHWDGDLSRLGGAALHDPTVCLPSIGSTLVAELPALKRQLPQGEIELRAYQFRTARGRTQFVFFQVWDAVMARPWADGEQAPGSRWQRVMDRRRSADIYQLILVIEAEVDAPTAKEMALERFIEVMTPVRGQSRSPESP